MVRSSSMESFPDIKSSNPVMEKFPGAPCYLSPSKIPRPKCLEESPVRINRPRSEVRNKDLSAVENQKAVIRKAAVVLSFQENEQRPELRSSQLHGFLKPMKMQEDGAIAALTPISVNVLSPSGGQGGRASSEKIVASLPAPAVKHMPKNILRQSDKRLSNSEELLNDVKLAKDFLHSPPPVAVKNLIKNILSPSDQQSSSSGECFHDPKLAKSMEDGGSFEVQNLGQTVVWSNAVFCTDLYNEHSPSTESIYSTHCSPSESLCAALNRSLDETGELLSLSLRRSLALSGRSSKLTVNKPFEKVSSPKGLVGDSSLVTLTVNSELGSRDKVDAEHCICTTDVSCTMITGSAMVSVTDRDSLNEAQCRNSAMDLELAAISMSPPTFTMQAVDLNVMQESDACEGQVNWASTKKILFNASPLRDEDCSQVSEAAPLQSPTLVANAKRTSTLIVENHEQLIDSFKSSTLFENIGENVELQQACTMTNPREPSIKESRLQVALPPHSIVHLNEPIVEADLEDEIQLDEIEDKISKEIIALSQKLAKLHSRRRRNSKLPAASKSPETSLLPPPVPSVTEENHHQNKSTCSGGRQRGKRPVAAKFLQSMTPQEEATSKLTSSASPRSKGKACFGMKGKQTSSPHPGKWRMSLGLRLSFASTGNNSHKCTRSNNGEQENSPPESDPMHEEGAIQSFQSPGDKVNRLGLSCPRSQPRTIRRFDWVKTLRSGESDLRSSPEARVSSRMYHQNTPTGRLLGGEPRPKNLEGATRRWRHDLNRNMVEELGNRLNCDHGATPADAHMSPDLQGFRCGGRVVASRYASSSPPADKHTKSPTLDGDEFLGSTGPQILKAVSRRSLAGDKSVRSKSGRRVNSRCLNSQGGIRPSVKSVGPLCGGVPAMKVNFSPESQAQESRGEGNVAPKMWYGAPETYQTEYETFLDGPDNGRNFAELFKASMRLHEDFHASSVVVSGGKQNFTTFSPREAFELSLPSDVKRNCTRCVELSVSTKRLQQGDRARSQVEVRQVSSEHQFARRWRK